jgi:hypothetical protein
MIAWAILIPALIMANSTYSALGSIIILLIYATVAMYVIGPFGYKPIPQKHEMTYDLYKNGDIHINIEWENGKKEVFNINMQKYIRYFRLNQANNSSSSGDFWYVFLDIPSNSSKETIMRKYKELAQKYHPDKPTGSETLMKLLNKAKDDGLKGKK